MKIVHVICGLRTGGAELMLADIVRCQAEQGHDVSLIVINDWLDRAVVEVLSPKVKKLFINRPQGSKNLWWILKYNLKLKEEKPDVVHFHDDKALGMTFRDKRKKYVYTIHDERLNLRYLHRADTVCSISKAVRDDIKKRYDCASVLVYNGIAVNEIRLADPVERTESFKIVQVSRLDHEKKGQDLLIEAVARLVNEGLDIKVDFIGDGKSDKFLKQMAEQKGISRAVTFLGSRTREYIYTHLCDYNLFVQPSRKEGFGLTIAEAMAAGVPVLVSDRPGPKEVVEDGELGVLFQSGNIDSLTEAIRHIYNEYETFYVRAKRVAAPYCRKMYDIENTANNYIKSYQ